MLSTILAIASLVPVLPSLQDGIGLPAGSPAASVSRTVGTCKISVDFCSPGVKGRAIFGGMVPYGEVWRTGANQPTTIEFSEPVTFGGKEVAAGKYLLATIPGKESWTVILNSHHEQWGTYAYRESEDVARVSVRVTSIEPAEWFDIQLSPKSRTAVDLNLVWERTRVTVPIGVDVDARADAKIEAALSKSPEDGNLAFEAADYYLQSNRKLERSWELFQKIASDEKNPYHAIILWRRGQVEWKLGKRDEAMKSFDVAAVAAKKMKGFEGVAREIEAMQASFRAEKKGTQ